MTEEEKIFDVEQSQLIENITPDKNSQLFRLHLDALEYALECVAKGEIPEVKRVHRTMMASSLTSAGSYRYEPVYIAGTGRRLPTPLKVRVLMDDWDRLCREFIAQALDDECKTTSLILYFHFLCIHPFEDGNGRVGRIMLNALRLLKGLSWKTVLLEERDLGVKALRMYEDCTFKVIYPNVYNM